MTDLVLVGFISVDIPGRDRERDLGRDGWMVGWMRMAWAVLRKLNGLWTKAVPDLKKLTDIHWAWETCDLVSMTWKSKCQSPLPFLYSEESLSLLCHCEYIIVGSIRGKNIPQRLWCVLMWQHSCHSPHIHSTNFPFHKIPKRLHSIDLWWLRNSWGSCKMWE